MTFLCSDLLFLNLLNQNSGSSYIITAFCEAATICFEVTFIVWFHSILQRKWRLEVKKKKRTPSNCSSPFQANQVGLKSFLPWVWCGWCQLSPVSLQDLGTGIPLSTSTGSCGTTALDTSQEQLPVLAATKEGLVFNPGLNTRDSGSGWPFFAEKNIDVAGKCHGLRLLR